MSKFENTLYTWVAYDWIGDGQKDAPPLTNDTLRLPLGSSTDPRDAQVISLLDDAWEIWFGYPDRWKWHMSRKDFHKIMRWYLKRWIFGEWLGLRRKVFYKLLHRRVERMKTANTPTQEQKEGKT